jgi:uncharacterized protein
MEDQMQVTRDVVGLGFRDELAHEIGLDISKQGEVECLEVIAEQFYASTPKQIAGLQTLAQHMPLSLHGVSLGLASTQRVEQHRADAMARMCELVRPAFWSEHLSFVRGGGAEIGHLAAPPRSQEVAGGAIANVAWLAHRVGMKPVLENVATLVSPPCSSMTESEWLGKILRGADACMLLDLHNLYANASNEMIDPFQVLDQLPLDRVAQIHLSGGVLIPAPGGGTRLLDDHVHDVPEAVFQLLEYVAARAARPLMVIIERDGRFPEFAHLLEQIRSAKHALKRGRAAQAKETVL